MSFFSSSAFQWELRLTQLKPAKYQIRCKRNTQNDILELDYSQVRYFQKFHYWCEIGRVNPRYSTKSWLLNGRLEQAMGGSEALACVAAVALSITIVPNALITSRKLKKKKDRLKSGITINSKHSVKWRRTQYLHVKIGEPPMRVSAQANSTTLIFW